MFTQKSNMHVLCKLINIYKANINIYKDLMAKI